MSHTSGPWTITGENSFRNPDEDKIWVDASPEFNHTADDESRWSVAELRGPDAKSNARLIAAAPELLEALETVAQILKLNGEGIFRGRASKQIGAAIAKATGGAR